MKTRCIYSAVLSVALLSAAGLAQAAEKEWKNTPQNWSWSAEPQCKLKVIQVTQPNESQPLHVTVLNASQVRLQYSLQVRVTRSGKEVFKDTISIDNDLPPLDVPIKSGSPGSRLLDGYLG